MKAIKNGADLIFTCDDGKTVKYNLNTGVCIGKMVNLVSVSTASSEVTVLMKLPILLKTKILVNLLVMLH